MTLFSKALAVGFGYVLAQPAVRQKIVELVRHPKPQNGRDQVQASNRIDNAKRELSRSSPIDTPNVDSTPAPLFAGVPTPTPSRRAPDRAALQEGVLPQAEEFGATTVRGDS